MLSNTTFHVVDHQNHDSWTGYIISLTSLSTQPTHFQVVNSTLRHFDRGYV
ncbi:MAG: hypothetical protein RRX89_06070 [Erysipelotrichaceae bacterium]